MLCGYFVSSSTGNLHRVEGKMDSLKCQEILGENVMPSVRKPKLGCHWTFQQDNDPKHTSNSTKIWFTEEVLEDSTVAITVTPYTISGGF